MFLYKIDLIHLIFLQTVDFDGLVLEHLGISSYSAEYVPIHFQLLWVKSLPDVPSHNLNQCWLDNEVQWHLPEGYNCAQNAQISVIEN